MTILEYAARCEKAWEDMQREQFGYERKTTFYADLTIAEFFGEKAIKDTYNRVCKSWMHDIKYITEFSLCLNHKSWEHSAKKGHENLVQLYADLWYKIKGKIYDHYENDREALDYFFNITD